MFEVTVCVDWITLRIAGIVRNTTNDNRVGIQFTHVTERKAGQIEYLIADLIEMEKHRRTAMQKATE